MKRDEAYVYVCCANQQVRDVNETMNVDKFARSYCQMLAKQYSLIIFIRLMARWCLHAQILNGY